MVGECLLCCQEYDPPMGLTPHVMAIRRVQQRLRRVTAALDATGVRYAVVGGNAVAAWVGRVD